MYKKVGIASAIMMASVFLSRVIGLFREMAIAYVGGAGAWVDAYQVAFIIPDILNHVVASGFLSVTFIPIFSKYLVTGSEDEGWNVVSIIMTTFGAFLILGILLGFILAPELISIFAPGLKEPLLLAMAVKMTRIILPAQFFFFSGGLLMAVQFARERFAVPALAPLVYNMGIIAGGLCLGPWLGMEGFAWGVLAGSLLGNFAIQLWGVKDRLGSIRFKFDLFHPDLKKYVLLTLPLMIGLTMTFSTEFFLKFFGSFLPDGSIAALNYGLRVTLMLVGFFGQAVGVASYPFMAKLAAEGKIGKMNSLLNETLGYLCLAMPVSVLLIVLRFEVVRVLFQRGRFDAAATELTGQALGFMLLGAFAFAAQTLVVRGFYALQNTLFPAIFGTVAVLASIPLYIVGLKTMGTNGVAMAISFSAILQVVLLYAIWNRKTKNRKSRQVYITYLKALVMSIVLYLLLTWLKILLFSPRWHQSLTGDLFVSILIGIIFVALMGFLAHILKIKQAHELGLKLIRTFAEKISRKG